MAGWEVRPSNARGELRLRLVLLLLLVALPAAFWAGWWWSGSEALEALSERQQLLMRLAEQEHELEQLRQRLAVVESGERLERQANEQSRKTIKLLEEQIFKQQQDLAFYKGVLAPASRREGLRIRAFELQATDQPRRFRYKLLLSRVGQDDRPLEGQLQVSVLGRQGGQDVSLELAALTKDLPDELAAQAVPFAFKHFQAIPDAGRFAELELPEGFEPRQVKVRAQVKGEPKALERTFKWLDEE